VFGVLVLNSVCRHVDEANIITKNDGGSREMLIKLRQELAKPSRLNGDVDGGTVLCFDAGARRSVLAFGGQGHQVVGEENTIAGGGAASIGTACPIRVLVLDQGVSCGRHELETVAKGALHVA
jgi:hypothetical protein